MEQLLYQFLPVLREIIVAVGIPIALLLARNYIARVKDKTLADALDRAVTNAAGEVINKLNGRALTEEVKATDHIVKMAASTIPRTNPEGVAHFAVTDRELQDKIVSKVGVLTAPSLTETTVVEVKK